MKHGPTYKQKGVSLAARAQGDGKKRLQRGERVEERERGGELHEWMIWPFHRESSVYWRFPLKHIPVRLQDDSFRGPSPFPGMHKSQLGSIYSAVRGDHWCVANFNCNILLRYPPFEVREPPQTVDSQRRFKIFRQCILFFISSLLLLFKWACTSLSCLPNTTIVFRFCFFVFFAHSWNESVDTLNKYLFNWCICFRLAINRSDNYRCATGPWLISSVSALCSTHTHTCTPTAALSHRLPSEDRSYFVFRAAPERSKRSVQQREVHGPLWWWKRHNKLTWPERSSRSCAKLASPVLWCLAVTREPRYW